MANALIFIYLVIFPFGQILRFNLSIFGLGITLQAIDVISLIVLVYVCSQKVKVVNYFLITALFSCVVFSLLYPSTLVVIGLFYFLRLAGNLSFFFLVNKTKKSLILNSLLGVIAVVGVVGWVQYLFLPDLRFLKIWGWDDHLYRLIGTFLDPTYTGIILVLGFFMALGKKSIWLGLFFLVTIAFTYSRASYLGFAGGLMLYALWQKKFGWPFLILLLFGVNILVLPRPTGEGVHLERTQSIYGRFRSYSEGLIIFKHNPLLGVGFNNYCYARQIYLKTNDLDSHACSGSDSSLLNILATTGVVGLVICLKLAITFYKRLKMNQYGIIFVVCSLALIVHSFFSNSLFYPWVLSLMAILAGLTSRHNEA